MKHEASIIQGVIERLNALPGVVSVAMRPTPKQATDGMLEIETKTKAYKIAIEVKKAAWQFRPDTTKTQQLWLAPIIPKTLAKKLRMQGIFYADTAGNIHIALPGFYVVQDSDESPLVDLNPIKQPGTIFNPTMTRVALQLLLSPKLLQAPLREMASASGVALRSVQLAIDEMVKEKCIVDLGKDGFRYHNKELLFRKFVEGYNQKLRPKLFIGRFDFAQEGKQNSVILDEHEACWGGDKAAEQLTKYLEPQDYLIYTYESHQKTLIKNRLKLAPKGSISIYSACWQVNVESMPQVAPAYVVYADLLHAQDPRCEDAAERLYENTIRGLLHD